MHLDFPRTLPLLSLLSSFPQRDLVVLEDQYWGLLVLEIPPGPPKAPQKGSAAGRQLWQRGPLAGHPPNTADRPPGVRAAVQEWPCPRGMSVASGNRSEAGGALIRGVCAG